MILTQTDANDIIKTLDTIIKQIDAKTYHLNVYSRMITIHSHLFIARDQLDKLISLLPKE